MATLADAWIYWREGRAITVLRTDSAGRFRAARPGADATRPESYTAPFLSQTGRQVDLCSSRGSRPIPTTLLDTHPGLFVRRTVEPTISLPAVLLTLTKPAELTLWPLLWTLPDDDYHTAGLASEAALWTGTHLNVTENAAAPAPPTNVRPRERGMMVEGTIDARATGVRIQVLNAAGNPLQLRPNATATTGQTEISGTLGAATCSTMRSFSATICFMDATAAFGMVQIVVLSDGMMPQIMEAYACFLVGLQVALVDDRMANTSGQQRGPILTESDEKIIVDFLTSPQAASVSSPANAAISAQTRARRMIAYQFANESRLLDPTLPQGANNPHVPKPQMPMWMAELQFVGLTRPGLADMMARRYYRQNSGAVGNPVGLMLDLQWHLTLEWDGPDMNSPRFAAITRHNQFHSYSISFAGTQAVRLLFGQQGQFVDAASQSVALGAGGEVPSAFASAPTVVPFPVSGRRLPHVIASGQNRAWGRQTGAAQRESLVIEFQPRIVSGSSEIIRGGDGTLALQTVEIGSRRIDGGRIFAADGSPTVPPSSDPDCSLPRFRVRGVNAPLNDVNALIGALAGEYFDAHAAQAHIALLPRACWQTTARAVCGHESGYLQFGTTINGLRTAVSAGRWGFAYGTQHFFYGKETDMPAFGPPHGYGIGQLDLVFQRAPSDEEVWSFLENLRTAVRVLMEEKAQAALGHFRNPAQAAATAAFNALNGTHRQRAMFQREAVRRYNGGREFAFEGGSWVVHPNVAQDRQPYPNNVLRTHVVYPGPIPFTPADYTLETA